MALKRKGKNQQNVSKTRKQLRKEKRQSKKTNRNDYYTNRKKPGQFVLNPDKNKAKNEIRAETTLKSVTVKSPKQEKRLNKAKQDDNNKSLAEKAREKEKKEQNRLQNDMNKQRNKQLVVANLEEDRNIKRLEKQLKLNKRKSKAVPKSFSIDGLDYLLEVCDGEGVKDSALAEQHLTEINEDFEEDFALMTKDNDSEKSEDDGDSLVSNFGSSDDELEKALESSDSDEDDENEEIEKITTSKKRPIKSVDTKLNKKRKTDGEFNKEFKTKKKNINVESEESDDDESVNSEAGESISGDDEIGDDLLDEEESEDDSMKKDKNEVWEDIYGRLRTKDGSVVNDNTNKYIPPAIRAKMEAAGDDEKRSKTLERLKKQLKGLTNRLAESNMHSIATQIEELFMNNSRNDMNNTITNLIIEATVSNVLAPERLLMEHVLLITILHANVGTEVGAHFLQTIVKHFDEFSKNPQTRNVENKQLDNIINILAQLYNFKLFDSKLIYEILAKLSENFEEKDVECILHVLRSIGFNLRKDNPLELKSLILNLQKRAADCPADLKNNPRLKFMLDALLAIKNNNVSKMPNYDNTYSTHLKKIMKGFIRKGNYVTQLNISLSDLLKADERGRWWIVGSAWAGNKPEDDGLKEEIVGNSFSQNLLELARKQRMNTDTRKNIFCIIMSAEDYLDAFEKLLRLSLKNQQEREIINVILHCCLQEKKYNPYYGVLAQKFCEHDRRFQMTIKYSIWDKLKTLNDHSATQISNLAKMLSFLFMEKGLPISTLKIVQFGDLDKVTLRFMRQILLGVLLHDDLEVCKEVFEKVAQSDKLKMFRESLRLFIHHFMLRNLKAVEMDEGKKGLLQERAKVVEKVLIGRTQKY